MPDRSAVGAAIFGTGRLATELLRGCDASGVRVVAGIVANPTKDGQDLGKLTVGEPVGVTVTQDVDAVLARDDVDVVLYGGLGGDVMLDLLERSANAGKDVITASGLIHAGFHLGEAKAERLDRRARDGGARLLGTGVNPGFAMDVLPALLATSMPDPVSIWAGRVSNITSWGAEVLRQELRVGGEPAAAGATLIEHMTESVHLIAAATGLELETIDPRPGLIVADQAREVLGIEVDAGRVLGFHHRVIGIVEGSPRIELEWQSTLGEPGGLQEGSVIRVKSPNDLETVVRLDLPIDSYPSTAARMIKSILPLRALAPGLRRPDELPIAQFPAET